MDYRETYANFRAELIELIINNADVINSSLDDKILGYVECGECDESIIMEDDETPFVLYNTPIFIIGIEDNNVIGYPASTNNVYYNVESWYDIKDIDTLTLISLVEKI